MNQDQDPVEVKRLLRAQVRGRRRARSAGERDAAARGICANLIAMTPKSRPLLVACYLSTEDEPGTRPYLDWAAGNGVDVVLPISRPDGTLDWVSGTGAIETAGLFGIAERVGPALDPGVVDRVDLFLIPAAAVDRTGMRMGWGRGYFDRTLATMTSRPPVIAVVFDDELVDSVPREPHDKPVDGAVTPLRVLTF